MGMAEDESDAMEEVAESREVREAGKRNKKPCRGRNCLGRRARGRSGKKAGKGGKGKEAADKSKKAKKAKKNRKRGNNRIASRGGASRSCSRSTDYTCLINAMTYLGLMKSQVTNYQKQQGRVVAANKTGEKKNGKKAKETREEAE